MKFCKKKKGQPQRLQINDVNIYELTFRFAPGLQYCTLRFIDIPKAVDFLELVQSSFCRALCTLKFKKKPPSVNRVFIWRWKWIYSWDIFLKKNYMKREQIVKCTEWMAMDVKFSMVNFPRSCTWYMKKRHNCSIFFAATGELFKAPGCLLLLCINYPVSDMRMH